MATINSKRVSFLFFSDGMEYVRNVLMPLLKHIDAEFVLVQGNKAYEDLILMSQCEYIIASQGSAGKVAAMINNRSQLIIPDINQFNRSWKNRIPSAILL